MGYKSRKSRLKNFQKRADSFYGDMIKTAEKNSTRVNRDNRQVLIGAGVHKRMILKNSSIHAIVAKGCEIKLISYLKINKIVPKTYVLSPVAVVSSGRVQEYFHKPSLAALKSYFFRKHGANQLTSEDYRLCKQFLGQKQNEGITPVLLEQALAEIENHFRQAQLPLIWDINIVALGRLKDGRLRLAIVDI